MSRDLDIRIEEHRAAKRRDTIKNLIIGFLILLLVLTFFSNTWMNRTLPEVSTVYVERGGISPKIRGTGTVEADDPYKVMSKQSRKISSVLVHVGDEVSIGDVLFELEDEESEELLKAEQELRAAEKALLDTRAKYPDCSLADLYDETTMPADLRRAHQANDRAVMAAYGFDSKMTEAEIVAELFKMYEKLTSKRATI